MKAEDGGYYAVKLRNNPQHRRILVNEWIAHAIFRQMRIATPESALIDIPQELIDREPELHIRLGHQRVPAAPGWHFGSRFVDDPSRLAIYDFLPEKLLGQVTNRHDFLGTVVLDRWLSNADARQAVFFRARVKQWAPSVAAHGSKVGFVAMMIDHGFVFNGPEWTFLDSPAHGLFHSPSVYADVTGMESFQPWLDQARYFPEAVIERVRREIPPAWLEGDEDQLDRLLERVLIRRKHVAEAVEACKTARGGTMFPKWKRS